MNFFIDLGRVCNGAANLLAQKAGVLFAQAVNKCLDRSHTDPQGVRNLLVRKRDFAVNGIYIGFKRFKYGRLSLGGVLLSEPGHCRVEQSDRPPGIKDLVCGQDIEFARVDNDARQSSYQEEQNRCFHLV